MLWEARGQSCWRVLKVREQRQSWVKRRGPIAIRTVWKTAVIDLMAQTRGW